MNDKQILCVVGRYPNTVPIPPGTRTDLTCDRCGRRVQTDRNSIAMKEAGIAELVCWECAEAGGVEIPNMSNRSDYTGI